MRVLAGLLCLHFSGCVDNTPRATDLTSLAACTPPTIDNAVQCLVQHANPDEVAAAAAKIDHLSDAAYEPAVTYNTELADWLLWKWIECGDPGLKDEVKRLGLAHPDDFVAIAINSYVADRSGRPRRVAQQAAFYQDYFDRQPVVRHSLVPAESPKRSCT